MTVEAQRLDAIFEAVPRTRSTRRLWLTAKRNPLGVLGLAIIILMLTIGILGPWIAPHGVNDFAGPPKEDPSADHPFGTDEFGRDMFSRVVFGTRISLSIGIIAVIGATVLGTALGITSAYFGGWFDNLIQRSVDVIIAFPLLILLIIIIAVLGPSIRNVMLVVAIAIVPGVTRVVRGATLSEKNNQYVEAAESLGATGSRIIFFHLFPNVISLGIVIMTSLLGGAILAEAGLAFLGLGAPSATNPSWGADINDARNSFPIHIWWAIFPGIAISLTVLAFNLLGDSLRDILDPRLRGSL
jgi:peptide/nickel transport system permease protein